MVVVLDLVTVLFLPVVDGGSDGVFRQDRAVNFDRRQCQLFDNLGVLDGQGFINGAAFDPFGGQGRRSNRRATAEAFELGVFDLARIIHFDLQLHYVATFRGADDADANIRAFFDVG